MKLPARLIAIFELFVLFSAVAVIILFTIFRFSYLSVSPPGFFVDESSIGYNAYSILKTGKDEYGKSFPLYFEAFGEYKNPIFIYSVVPMLALFGETIAAVRVTSALWGGATILVLFFLLRYAKVSRNVSIVTLLLVVTTPWFFQLSRVAFEVASLPFFLISAIFCFYILVHTTFKKRQQSLLMSCLFALMLGLLFYTYTSARILSPLLLIYGIYIVRKKIGWKNSIAAGIIFVLCLLPLFLSESFQNGAMMARYNVVGLSHHTDSWFDFVLTALKNYFAHFFPKFLILSGDENLRHVVAHYGVFLSGALPFIIAGIFHGLKNKKDIFFRWIIYGFLISPIPSALTIQSPHVLRAVGMLVFAFICMWYGVEWFFQRGRSMKLAGLLCVVIVIIQALFFLHFYVTDFTRIARPWFDAGTVESIQHSFTYPGPYYYSLKLYPGTYASVAFFNTQNRDLIFFDPVNEFLPAPGTYVYDYANCAAIYPQFSDQLTLISQIDGICLLRNASNF